MSICWPWLTPSAIVLQDRISCRWPGADPQDAKVDFVAVFAMLRLRVA